MAVEDVVAQHQAAGLAGNEFPTDQIGLRQAIGAGLGRVLDAHAPLRTVAQQLLEHGLLVRGIDYQHFAYAGQHQHAERVVDHRLVVYRQQLLADGLGQRIQARARPSGEDDSLALHLVLLGVQSALPMRSRR